MSRDLDARGRNAASGLKSAVQAAELTSTAPVPVRARRPLVAVLRPAIVLALLLVGAAVGVAVVRDSSPPATTVPAVVPSSVGEPAESLAEPEPVTPTTAYVPPTTTAPPTTVAPDTEAPHLEITSPEDGATLEKEAVTFEGITEPGARVFSGRWEAEVSESGEWHIVLILSEGANTARFTAKDASGNESEASITVHYAPKTTTTTVKELAEFKAYATFGSCAETPPYDIYHGKGEPGSMVFITSEYGSGSVEVNAEGHWEKKVIFESAPENETFVVTVSDEFGRSKQFEFIHEPA